MKILTQCTLVILLLLFTGCQAQTPTNYKLDGPISVGQGSSTITFQVFSTQGCNLKDYSALIDKNEFLMWMVETTKDLKHSTPGQGAPVEVGKAFSLTLSNRQAINPAARIGEDHWVQLFTQGTTAWTAVYDLNTQQVVLLKVS
jgi:hypothetical protein